MTKKKCKDCEFYTKYDEPRSKGSARGYCSVKMNRYVKMYGTLTGIKTRWPEVSQNQTCTEVNV